MTDADVQKLLDQPTYYQMTPVESNVARHWLRDHAKDCDQVRFNVVLGSAIDIGDSYPPALRAQAAAASQKRADLVCLSGSEVTILEVKGRLTLGAMGQLLGYAALWSAEHPETTVIHLIGIANTALEDVPEVFQAHGIAVILYPDPNAY